MSITNEEEEINLDWRGEYSPQIEELRLMAAGSYHYDQVAAMVNRLPIKKRKDALIIFLDGSLGHNTVDAIDFNEIIRRTELPDSDRAHLIEMYQKHLHD